MCNFLRQDYFVYSQGQNEIEKDALISDQGYSKKTLYKATEINVRLKDVCKARENQLLQETKLLQTLCSPRKYGR